MFNFLTMSNNEKGKCFFSEISWGSQKQLQKTRLAHMYRTFSFFALLERNRASRIMSMLFKLEYYHALVSCKAFQQAPERGNGASGLRSRQILLARAKNKKKMNRTRETPEDWQHQGNFTQKHSFCMEIRSPQQDKGCCSLHFQPDLQTCVVTEEEQHMGQA